MRRLYIKQRMFAFGGEQFDVTDEDERPVYHVEGSFMRIPKSFTITDGNGFEVARIEKKTLSWLPHFSVIVDGILRRRASTRSSRSSSRNTASMRRGCASKATGSI